MIVVMGATHDVAREVLLSFPKTEIIFPKPALFTGKTQLLQCENFFSKGDN